jgi:hypothetical protein
MSDTSWRANYVTSSTRAVGGRLTVEDGTVTFRAHAFDRALAGRSWSAPLADVTVSIAPRRPLSHLFAAGLRRQLVLSSGGEDQHFIVNRVDRVADAIRALAATAPGSAAS